MAFFDNPIITLLSLDLIRQISTNDHIDLLKLNTFTTMLINQNIPFDVSYTPGTRKDSPGIQLTIHINPATTMVFNITL